MDKPYSCRAFRSLFNRALVAPCRLYPPPSCGQLNLFLRTVINNVQLANDNVKQQAKSLIVHHRHTHATSKSVGQCVTTPNSGGSRISKSGGGGDNEDWNFDVEVDLGRVKPFLSRLGCLRSVVSSKLILRRNPWLFSFAICSHRLARVSFKVFHCFKRTFSFWDDNFNWIVARMVRRFCKLKQNL